jgi:predicted nucleic acid-binding protein
VSVFLDTSALVKLVVAEDESEALRDFLQVRPARAASALARVELRRAAARVDAALVPSVEQLLAALPLLRVDEALLDDAGRLAPPSLRSLDAIHLASAMRLRPLEALVTYDERMAVAGAALGLPVAAPGR